MSECTVCFIIFETSIRLLDKYFLAIIQNVYFACKQIVHQIAYMFKNVLEMNDYIEISFTIHSVSVVNCLATIFFSN